MRPCQHVAVAQHFPRIHSLPPPKCGFVFHDDAGKKAPARQFYVAIIILLTSTDTPAETMVNRRNYEYIRNFSRSMERGARMSTGGEDCRRRLAAERHRPVPRGLELGAAKSRLAKASREVV